ncbi:MAG: CapA family protein, partial [Alphaproteobacteria bacterium]|nr:CapA family protein [Alphaproteobacteria bacterium]
MTGLVKDSQVILVAGLALLVTGCASTPPSDAKPGEGISLEPITAPAPAPLAPTGPVRLVGVGDIMMGTDFPEPGYLNPDLTPGADLSALIGPRLLNLLQSADITFGNMEGSLFDGDGEHKSCKNPKSCYVFRSPE